MADAALRMENVSKRYTGTLAVDGVDFEVRAGEVHALVGENGAGKSTLMKMLAGSFSDYTGRILIGGKEVALHSPAVAKAGGIQMVHQELSLARPLSIAENVLAGRLPRRGPLLDRPAMLAEARRCLARTGLDLDPETPVEHEAADDRAGGEASRLEHLGQCQARLGQPILQVVTHPVSGRQGPREHGDVGGQGHGHWRVDVLEQHPLPGHGVDVRRGRPREAIGAQVVCSERVDADQENVADGGPRSGAGKEEPGAEAQAHEAKKRSAPSASSATRSRAHVLRS